MPGSSMYKKKKNWHAIHSHWKSMGSCQLNFIVFSKIPTPKRKYKFKVLVYFLSTRRDEIFFFIKKLIYTAFHRYLSPCCLLLWDWSTVLVIPLCCYRSGWSNCVLHLFCAFSRALLVQLVPKEGKERKEPRWELNGICLLPYPSCARALTLWHCYWKTVIWFCCATTK